MARVGNQRSLSKMAPVVLAFQPSSLPARLGSVAPSVSKGDQSSYCTKDMKGGCAANNQLQLCEPASSQLHLTLIIDDHLDLENNTQA